MLESLAVTFFWQFLFEHNTDPYRSTALRNAAFLILIATFHVDGDVLIPVRILVNEGITSMESRWPISENDDLKLNHGYGNQNLPVG